FVSSRRRHTRCYRDWSSDVCSSDLIMRLAYDAYGNLLGAAVGIVNPPVTKMLYTGQQLDPNLVQYYLRARFYDPATGRFTAIDQIGRASCRESVDIKQGDLAVQRRQ